ncbi:Glycosyltransferase involved in cell wall bisynthesis [Butyrivibrio hungatei DSM 14810]|uniref:Glycosyltransferase involved in cell wall bisynthesis n=1 Tax=Butyrivibrio hungatei DSM 14810 TaxID=1121132 RepID=A0A1M7SPW6_9FIRM|nr:bifunctional glycosyltransferase family 2/GtrA family protein [Butyrivibrio hungatei]SHN60474.1 Glycosyltransferase involved in cell wall bisynthesis [Butyrivibrio hungatei DSM 14810]
MTKRPTDAAILIPSLNPDNKIIELVKKLKEAGFRTIVCVDDGSSEEHRHFFDELKNVYGCDVLRHCVNMGKGRGIKTGLNHIRNNYPEVPGVITVDSDGQHSTEDTFKCAEEMIAHPDSVIFGCRRFKEEGVPLRSFLGNTITRWVMRLLCGIKLSDTQTGLRAIPQDLITTFVNAEGERYEYEMQQILMCKELGIPIIEVPIRTIYIDENKSSHFNPLRDSIKIYAQFGKFIFSSLSSAFIDIALFTLMVKLIKGSFGGSDIYISIATVTARVISAIWNFGMNKRVVFKSKAELHRSGFKYAALAVCQVLMSAFLVTLFHRLTGGNDTVIKIIVDTMLFFISYQIQREIVFK